MWFGLETIVENYEATVSQVKQQLHQIYCPNFHFIEMKGIRIENVNKNPIWMINSVK